jgi:hypothetical protein
MACSVAARAKNSQALSRSAALVSISTAVRLAGHRWRLGRNGIATDRR